jgi:hypothetical protein
MTAEALLGRQYLGWDRDTPAMLQGASMIAAHLEESAERNIYYWYYATQLLHNLKGKEWERWNVRVRDGLVGMQVHGESCDRGSWDPALPESDHWGERAGRLYMTSLSLLTLEVYYRYLPLYGDTEDGMDAEAPPRAGPGGPPAAGAPERGQSRPELKPFNKDAMGSDSIAEGQQAAPSAGRPRSTSSPK